MDRPPKVLLPKILGAQRALADELIQRGFAVAPALVRAALENLRRVMRGEPPLYMVNPEVLALWRERLARLDRTFGPLTSP